MAYRCPHYRCEATTIDGLIQQVALSYLRHGYWWYVTGSVPERKDVLEVDHNILTKYGIRKDWRYVAHNKSRGIANVQYIRYGRFYIIMATKGLHEFKEREAKRIRDARQSSSPILVPRFASEGIGKGERSRRLPFDGYAIGYRRGGYLKKSPEEKAAYKLAMEEWKRATRLGRRLPKPPKGTPDPKWHSCVEIERNTWKRLRSYYLEIATRRSADNLAFEFTNSGYVPYAPVKRQLVRIIKDVNKARQVAGCGDQIPYRVVLGLKRNQIMPFGKTADNTGRLAA
ncbi:MAG: hypothetical protein AAF497_10500 [Planctomycetota bacterium]